MFHRITRSRPAAFAAAAALALAWVAPRAGAAPTLAYKLVYAGHTTANTDATLTGTAADLTSAAFQASTVRHYFDVYALFTPTAGAAGAGDDFRQAQFDVKYGAGLVPITKAGASGGVANKWFGNNPSDANAGGNVFSTNGDAGTAGDLLGIVVQQTDPSFAFNTQVGESGGAASAIGFAAGQGSKFGRVAFAFTGTLSADTFLQISPPTGGGNFGYFTNNQAGDSATFLTPASDPTGATGATFAIAVPEPGAAAVLGVSAAGWTLRRRHRRPR